MTEVDAKMIKIIDDKLQMEFRDRLLVKPLKPIKVTIKQEEPVFDKDADGGGQDFNAYESADLHYHQCSDPCGDLDWRKRGLFWCYYKRRGSCTGQLHVPDSGGAGEARQSDHSDQQGNCLRKPNRGNP